MPVHIYWQMQTQLLVSGAELAHLYVFDGTSGILLEQRPEASAWDTLRQDWDRFMDLVRDRPAATADRRGTRVIRDRSRVARRRAGVHRGEEAGRRHRGAKLDALKQRLIGLARHSSEQGGGVSVSRYWKTGTVDYKKVPELRGRRS